MKNKNWIPSIIGGLIGFLAGWCAALCMITGFRLTVDHPEQIWMVCGLASLICALAFPLRWGKAAVAGLGIVWLVWSWKQGEAWEQLRQLVFRLSHILHVAYRWPELAVAGKAWNGGTADIPMQLLSCLVAAVCCHTVGRGRRTWPAVTAAAVPLALCLMVTDTVPGEKWLFGLLLCLVLLVLTSSVRRESTLHGARLLVLAALPVAAFLACLFLAVPRESYVNKAEEYREKILDWVENVPARTEEAAQKITATVSGTAGDRVNLETLGPQTTLAYPVLEVTADRGGVLYLRQQDYDSYTGTGWTATPHRSEAFFGAAGEDAGQVKIKTRARRDTLFLPYYPGADAILTGGKWNNPESLREYTLEQTVLPDDWRELVEERYGGTWSSRIEFTATQERSDYLDANRYLILPVETRLKAGELLDTILSGESSATVKADRIAAYVRGSAEYDRNTSRMDAGAEDFALWFLEESDTGYCVHFATAAVVLLRAADIPARYVSGYMVSCQPGEPVTVTADMAHAWAEYFEPQLGRWIPLEATPADALRQPADQETTPSSEPEAQTRPTAPKPTQPPETQKTPEGTAPSETPEDSGKGLGKLLGLLWVLLPAAILEGQRLVRRKLRSIRRGGPNEQALKLWQQVRLLAALRREPAPKGLHDLAQKAKFSQHTLSREELAELETYVEDTTAILRTGPWYKRLVWRYVFAVL